MAVIFNKNVNAIKTKVEPYCIGNVFVGLADCVAKIKI